jgi:hypothetical protein
MSNNPVLNSLTFTGSVAGQASIQAQGVAGGLTFLLPNIPPIQGQQITVTAVNGTNVFLGWSSPQSAAPLVSPNFTGIPTAPSAPQGTTNTQIATTFYADQSSNNVYNNAIAFINSIVRPFSTQTINTGGSQNINISNGMVFLDPAGAGAAIHAVLPASPRDGDRIIVLLKSTFVSTSTVGPFFIGGGTDVWDFSNSNYGTGIEFVAASSIWYAIAPNLSGGPD